MCVFVALVFTGCNKSEGVFSVRRDLIDVGQANIGDSVRAIFTVRNNTNKRLGIKIIPECDCTTVSMTDMRLEPHRCGQLEVKVAVESQGEFIKYVYVQASGSDDFLAVAVKGRTK